MDEKTYIQIGQIYREHGVKGYCKIHEFSDYFESIQIGVAYFLISPEKRKLKVKVTDLSQLQRYLLVKFDVLNSPEDIHPWRKSEIWIAREDLPQSEGDELLDHEWQGFQVLNPQKEVIGVIKRIAHNPLKQFCVLTEKQEEEVMIPFVKDWILNLDKKKKIVTIAIPEGLLEI